MPSLLLRDIDEATKKQIALKAVENGRSQSAEACAALRQHYLQETTNPFLKLFEACQADDGFEEFELPARHQSRIPDVWWLQNESAQN